MGFARESRYAVRGMNMDCVDNDETGHKWFVFDTVTKKDISEHPSYIEAMKRAQELDADEMSRHE